MAIKITPDKFSLLIQKLSKQWRMFAPSAEFLGGRFSDTDNSIYQQISGWRDLIWHEKSHMLAEYHYRPYHRNALLFR